MSSQQGLSSFNDTTPPIEKAWLVGVVPPGGDEAEAVELLQELKELVGNLRWEVAGEEVVRLRALRSEFLLGSGKVEEIVAEAKARGVTIIILDHELMPSQQRNWERFSGLKVIDRQEVILDIFLERAQTKEAVLQVELACLEYTLPRLRRAWNHLSRQRGGGGSAQKGEGETQLELDQRMIYERVTKLKRELKEVVQHRAIQRSRRLKIPIPTAAIVGYTNAGKSSLLNALTQSQVLAEDKLFATLDPSTRRMALPSGQTLLITDTVGFIRRLPHRLVEAFKATLEESLHASFLLHVLDVANPSVEAHYETTQAVLKELKADEKRTLIVFNKIDLLDDEARIEFLKERFPEAWFISTRTGEGVQALAEGMEALLREEGTLMTLCIPFQDYLWVNRLHEVGAVLKEVVAEEGAYIIAQVPSRLVSQLVAYKFEGVLPEPEGETKL